MDIVKRKEENKKKKIAWALITIKRHKVLLVLGAVMVASFFIMLFSARQDSLTVDEKVHISAGYLHVWQGDYTFNSEHPPLLNNLAGLFAKIAKPNSPSAPISSFEPGSDQWEYGDLFFYRSQNNVSRIIFWARLPFIFLTLGLIYLVYLFSRALFGQKAGLLSAALIAFSPSILAHGRLATTDIGLAFFFFLTCYLLRKYYLKSNWRSASLLGISLGLTVLSKFSGLAVLPIVFLGLIFIWIAKMPRFWSAFIQFLVIIFIPLILMWLIYAFSVRSDLSNLSEVYKLSKILGFREMTSNLGKWILIPFDKFFQGYEILADHNANGHWSYLNGVVDYRGWWYYFPLVLWYKMTLVEIGLFILAWAAFFWKKWARTNFFNEFLIIFPPLLFLAISMIGRIDIGIRHILVVLPFFFVFIGRLVRFPMLKKVFAAAVLIQIIITILAFPNFIAYFNKIAGGSRGGIRHLADSNLDWNQNMDRLAKYLKQNQIQKVYELCWDSDSFTYRGIENEILPNSPVSGVVVICAQQKVVPPEGFNLDWVVNPPTGGPPDDVIANGIYVWRFDQKPVKLR